MNPHRSEGKRIEPKIDPDIVNALAPQELVLAYAHGVFPMVEDGQLMWFSPDPRGLLPLDERFHVSRRLKRTIRSGRFACTVDRAYDDVVDQCAARPDGTPTWISPEIQVAYRRLFDMGFAHSVEAWPADVVGTGRPVGGLYGVAIAGAFFAESMFHSVTDAGKAAVVFLIERLRQRGYLLCDIQWTTPNLCRFGAYDMPREEYLERLMASLDRDCSFE